MPYAEINEARLWYEIIGDGEPLLLHHGYTACRDNWMPVVDRLSAQFQVILMECRGAGASEDTADGYSLEQYAADVIGLLDHLGIDRVSYGGHSMGGGIGWVLATRYAERLNRLIQMAPVHSDGFESDGSEWVDLVMHARATQDRELLLDAFELTAFHPTETRAWFESRVDNLMRVSEPHLKDSMTSMASLRLGEKLPEIDMPVLVLAANADGLLTANLADYEKLPNAALHVFSFAGHDIALHEPEGVAQAIEEFMTFGVVSAATLATRKKD